MHLGDQRAGGVEREEVAARAPRRAPTSARHARRRSPALASSGHLVELLDEDRALGLAGSRPRSGCGRSRGAHRPARRSARAPARRSGWPAPRRRRSRAASRAGPGAAVLPRSAAIVRRHRCAEMTVVRAPTWAVAGPPQIRSCVSGAQLPIFRRIPVIHDDTGLVRKGGRGAEEIYPMAQQHR